MTITEFRNQFPHIRENRIIFDHAALGPICDTVRKSIDDYLDKRSDLQPDFFEWFLSIEKNAKALLAKLLHVDRERLAWIDNVSNGLNVLAQGIDWKHGDRIILNDIEFPSNIYPFMNLKKYGVEIDIVKSRNGVIEIDDIDKLITPRTKLISVSFVQFLSGYRIDLYALGQISKKHDIIFCVDGIQGAGVVDVDITSCNIDFFVGGTQKWLMSLMGLSYFYIAEELQKRIYQKYVGWLSVKNAWNLLEYNLDLKNTAECFQTGTTHAVGITALNSVLEIFHSFGIDQIENHVLSNSRYLTELLTDYNFCPLLRDVSDKNLAGIISFPHERPTGLMQYLNQNGITASVREGMIRLSPHFYNTHEEIDKVITLVKNFNFRND